MKDQFLYETFIPAITILIIALLCAEFIGRAKHIGRFYTFFMMLGLIPGIIGLLLSPSAKKNPTKGNSTYTLLGIFLIIAGGFWIFQDLENITFIQIFVSISFIISAFYCFNLSKGNIVNKEPKFYFNNTANNNAKQVKSSLDKSISNLRELKNKGILTDEEYKTKVAKINAKKDEQSLKNSLEYRQLKSLLDGGILTKEEFESKLIIITQAPKRKVIETYDFDITLINKEVLTILNIPENSNDILGCYVKLTDNKNLRDVYISHKYLYEVKNEKIIRFYSPKKIKLKDGTLCLFYSIFNKPKKGDFIFHTDYSSLTDGIYSLGFLNKIEVKENRLV